jgi:hypothetical protein
MEATIFKVLGLLRGGLMEIMHGLFADLVDGVPCITVQTPCKKNLLKYCTCVKKLTL